MINKEQRYRPYGWLCLECGVLKRDSNITENFIPMEERYAASRRKQAQKVMEDMV